MRIVTFVFLSIFLVSCDPKDMQKVLDTVSSTQLTNADISAGLKQALDKGVEQSVRTLAAENGYYASAYKILLPSEAQSVVNKLRVIPGFENLEEEAVKKINKAAEDAASKASPIFINAIKQMTINDVMGILMGEKNAATQYLHNSTYNALYGEFKPVMVNSLNKFGALDYYGQAVNKYNSLPFVNKVNPDLADYVTQKALVGLFALIEKKELGIRTDISQRSTDLMRKVFAKQD